MNKDRLKNIEQRLTELEPKKEALIAERAILLASSDTLNEGSSKTGFYFHEFLIVKCSPIKCEYPF